MKVRFDTFLAMVLAYAAIATGATPSDAQDADLAQKLTNPIASLISVPFQFNYDGNIGPNDGDRVTLNIQPVIPISISKDWNVISRTILPVTWQNDIAGPSGEQFGLGDTEQSAFLSPKAPGPGGIIWGAGPIFLFPTDTDPLLGGEKWGAGPTAVALRQSDGWTYGMLVNHVWSFAGDNDRKDVSTTFLQPFLAYTTSDAWTFALNTETSYDWKGDTWSVPVNLMVSKLVNVGGQPISLQAGVRYWATSPDAGPEEFGARVAITFLFPK